MTKKIVRRDYPEEIIFPDNIHPVLRRVYSARNITHEDELDTSLNRLLSYQALLNIDRAVLLLSDALRNNKRIVIVADYDVDGATGCALAIRGLRAMGFADLQYIVPSRFDFGYGLSPEIVDVAAEMEPDILITVDNGISSIEGVGRANENGIDVLITDHHLPGERLPDAKVIINPNQKGDNFPSKCLAGVGVMFYILAALRAYLRDNNWFSDNGIKEPNLAELLDLVALGTVADVVPLDINNRVIVAQGLARIRAGKCVPAIKALLKLARRSHLRITAGDLGFAVGPRLNAAGRLEDMSLGIECLLCDDNTQAVKIAARLDELNRERKEIQKEMQNYAETEVSSLNVVDELPYGISLYNPEWHQGVIGILASKVKDKWNRPVIVFASDRNGYIKGSARSIKGVNIRDVLESISTKQPGLITKFGGHAMAAGLTIRNEDFDRFRLLFDHEVQKQVSQEDLEEMILTDGELSAGDMTLSLAEEITSGGPWGQEFPEPLFDGVFEITDRKILADQHLKMSLKIPDSNRSCDAIAFFTHDVHWPERVEQVKLVYRLDVNEFTGRRKLQLIADYVEPVIK